MVFLKPVSFLFRLLSLFLCEPFIQGSLFFLFIISKFLIFYYSLYSRFIFYIHKDQSVKYKISFNLQIKRGVNCKTWSVVDFQQIWLQILINYHVEPNIYLKKYTQIIQNKAHCFLPLINRTYIYETSKAERCKEF